MPTQRAWDLIDYKAGCGPIDTCYANGETLELLENVGTMPEVHKAPYSTIVKVEPNNGVSASSSAMRVAPADEASFVEAASPSSGGNAAGRVRFVSGYWQCVREMLRAQQSSSSRVRPWRQYGRGCR